MQYVNGVIANRKKPLNPRPKSDFKSTDHVFNYLIKFSINKYLKI